MICLKWEETQREKFIYRKKHETKILIHRKRSFQSSSRVHLEINLKMGRQRWSWVLTMKTTFEDVNFMQRFCFTTENWWVKTMRKHEFTVWLFGGVPLWPSLFCETQSRHAR